MVRCGDALVVYDGPRRLRWIQVGVARWRPCGVWPSSAEAAEVAEVVRRGDPVLIILDRRPEPVHVLAEELTGAPREVGDLVTGMGGEVVELRIPPLTWLPEDLAVCGQGFLDEVAARLAGLPMLLLPALLLSSPGGPADNVWFGLRVRSTGWSCAELTAVVDHLQASRHRVPAVA